MKYLITFYILTFSIPLVFTQHDTIREYYPDNTLKYELVELDGIRDGHFIKWYSNGKIMMSTNWVLGIQSGLQKHYYENGKIQSKSKYKNGEIIIFRSYHENGKKMGVSRGKGRKIKEKEWTANGNLLRKIKSKDEVFFLGMVTNDSDTATILYPQYYCGNVKVEQKNNKYFNEQGDEMNLNKRLKKIIYWENGKKRYESRYRYGKGYEQEWDKSGELIKDIKL